MFKKIITSAFVAVMVSFTMSAQESSSKQVVVKAGTPVILSTTSSVSSKRAATGTSVDFQVVMPVVVEGETVVPAGFVAKGVVSSSNRSSALGKGGDITVSINAINAVDGTLIPISGGTFNVSGRDKTGLSIICGLCTLFGFLIHGQEAEIPVGTQVQAIVMANSTVTL